MNRFVVALGVALVGAVGFGQQASAVALLSGSSISGGPSITIPGSGGETFTEVGCVSSSISCTGLQMLQDGTNVGVTLSSLTAGGNILSTTANLFQDATITLAVSGPNIYNQVGVAVTGSDSASPTYDAKAGVGETVTSTPNSTGGATLASVGEQWISLPAGYSSLDLIKDIFIHGTSGGSGATLKVTTVTQDLRSVSVPEPASLALLLVGMSAIAASRRARSRS
jgi:hypothetical protein